MNRTLLLGVVACLFATSALAQGDTAERRALITPVPEYPKRALRERVEGDVQVCYTVDVNGRVHRPRVQTTSHRWFNRAAVRAARGLLYEPANAGAANSTASLCSTFRFRLNRDGTASNP